MEISELIKKERQKQGLSVFKVALKTGVTERTIRNYENGLRTPNIDYTDKICKALGITVKLGVNGDIDQCERT